MKFFLTIILSLFVFAGVFAQPENATVETINGKKYYVHIVQQGNTLYGIHKLYNTSVENILKANEGLTDDLTVGQKILIPISKADESHYGTHVVSEGETLYGISKQYKCSVSDLKSLNPGIEDGIVPGQNIKVPLQKADEIVETIQDDPEEQQVQYDLSFKDSIVHHTVLEHETMYSISKRYMVSMDTIRALNGMRNNKIKKGDVIKIPVKKVNYEVIQKDINTVVLQDSLKGDSLIINKKDVYNVALMLPFMLDRNDVEMNKTLMIDQVRELYPTTKIAFQFYQGFLLAADSLTKAGLNINLYVYDTKKDTGVVAKLFQKPEFGNMDLVVGPLYSHVISYTVSECKKRGIKIVLPFKADAKVLHNNPMVYKAVASNMTLMDGIVDYIIENHAHHNVLLFKPHTQSDLAIYERVRDRYNQKIAEKKGAYNTKIKEVTLGSKSGRDLDAYVNSDTVNVFIIPSENVKYVASAMLRLNSVLNINYRAKNMKLIAFGLEDWNQFDDLDVAHRVKLNQHYASYRYVNYNVGKGLQFVKAFRHRFGIDPSVYSSQGFDIGLYFMGALHLFGTEFDPFLDQFDVDLIQNDFKFKPISENSGNENSRVCIVKYQDYQLVLMN